MEQVCTDQNNNFLCILSSEELAQECWKTSYPLNSAKISFRDDKNEVEIKNGAIALPNAGSKRTSVFLEDKIVGFYFPMEVKNFAHSIKSFKKKTELSTV